jgi:lycopene beta-cyclase
VSGAAPRPRRWDTELVVAGDGPAGSALAAACVARGIDTLLVGDDAPWTATYASFVADLDGAEVLRGRDVFAHRLPGVAVHAARDHVLRRPYGVLDNAALRTVLRDDLDHLKQRVAGVDVRGRRASVTLGSGALVEARVVVDATGWPPAVSPPGGAHGRRVASRPRRWAGSGRRSGPAWQTAFGVVLAEPPAGDLGEPVLMDFRPVAGGPAAPAPSTFAYAVPVGGGWLVEETVLAARPAVEPAHLEARLAARLGRDVADLRAAAVAVEEVRIPMGAPLPGAGRAVVPFGAAAAYGHPATGYSLAASLGAAPRVAAAIASALGRSRDPAGDGGDGAERRRTSPLDEAVWPGPLRRTRALHEFGLDVLLGLDADAVREFFSTFFELDERHWAAYLRVDATPREVTGAMTRVFLSAPWSLRRRLMTGDPRRLLALLGR